MLSLDGFNLRKFVRNVPVVVPNLNRSSEDIEVKVIASFDKTSRFVSKPKSPLRFSILRSNIETTSEEDGNARDSAVSDLAAPYALDCWKTWGISVVNSGVVIFLKTFSSRFLIGEKSFLRWVQ